MSKIHRLPLLIQGINPELIRRGYILERQLSELGVHGNTNSVVWLAQKDGEQVALKISSYGLMESYDSPNLEKLQDFVGRERTILKQAGNHPSIPNFIEAFDIPHEEGAYVAYVTAMQYLNATPIRERMDLGMRLSEEEAKMIFRDDLSALGYIHQLGAIHRDVKPENIYINGERAYISDFGIVNLDGKESGTTLMAVYYPIDIFNRDGQNTSQDLVALGNVVIAGALAKEIDRIRYEQGKGGLDSVDVTSLPYSEGMRKFLDMLTAYPEKRYKTANQALSDLERLTRTPLPAQISSNEVSSLENSTQPVSSKELVQRKSTSLEEKINRIALLPHKKFSFGFWNKKEYSADYAVGFPISDIKGNAELNLGIGAVVGGNAGLNLGAFAVVGGNAELNLGGICAVVYGNAELNLGIGAVVGGNAELNLGAIAVVGGNAGLNLGGICAVVEGNAKDFELGDVFGRFKKYIPEFLSSIALPSVNAGLITHTGGTRNAYIFGLFNNINQTETENGDYIALGLLNRIKQKDGKVKWRPLISGKVTLDGILRHEIRTNLTGRLKEAYEHNPDSNTSI